MAYIFSTSVTIKAAPSEVWMALTNSDLVAKWMGEPEMNLEVHTDWKINSPIFIRGFHHVEFENKGIVIEYEEEKKLKYSHLSSVSRLPDIKENYSILEFTLMAVDEGTLLVVYISNFPTETIRKHLEFYWRTSVVGVKRLVEEGGV